ncbi:MULTISPECIES: TadE/TadG family type IV pilus assembly protein [unclassified Streptomyces]|uniref:TadE/TadG family type IV pilus assembly protein n=1 Tax=unclassified Streptomyces TaxID=2593676 RepID=UPI00074A0CBC|nr:MULTISPECIES: TadE/TadG family type IV pilus assembly protein [unclassified Streptomyces]KUL47334.1 pilus assembly protein TadE [Streptomyces sp. NRRL S-1521]
MRTDGIFAGRRRGRGLRDRDRRRRRWDDRGVSMLEFAGFLPVLLLVGLAAIQLGLVGYAAGQAGSGARAAARAASQGDSGQAAGAAAMDSGLDSSVGVSQGGDTTTATVEVQVPTLLPFVDTGWSVTKEATMPNDEDAGQ